MEWERVRAHYVRVFQESGRTQQEVATAAGLEQGVLSKLMANRREGPRAETLLRAIAGLGLLPSMFFAQLDDAAPPVSPRHADDEDVARLRRVGLALRAFEQTFAATLAPRRRRKRRARRG